MTCQLQPGGVTTDRHPASWINGRLRHVPVTRGVIRTNTFGDCMALNTERNRERIEGLFEQLSPSWDVPQNTGFGCSLALFSIMRSDSPTGLTPLGVGEGF